MKVYVAINSNIKQVLTDKFKEEVATLGEVRYFDKADYPTPEEYKAGIQDADIVFGSWGTPMLDKEVLEHAKNLKIYAYAAGSMTEVVCDDTFDAGIKVFGANCVMAKGVAEATLADIFFGLRKINNQIESMKNGGWESVATYGIRSLENKTIAIIGFGMIAKELIKYLKPFNLKIKVWADYEIKKEDIKKYGIEVVSLDEALKAADIVSFHAALNEKTCGIITKEKLDLLKDDALIVNTARAGILDEYALIERLKSGKNFAVLDVYLQEPLPSDHILRKLPNVIAKSHTSGSIDGGESMGIKLVNDIKKYLNGEKDIDTWIERSYVKNMTSDKLFYKLRDEAKKKYEEEKNK